MELYMINNGINNFNFMQINKTSNEQQPTENLKCYIQGILPSWKPLYWILQYKQSRYIPCWDSNNVFLKLKPPFILYTPTN